MQTDLVTLIKFNNLVEVERTQTNVNKITNSVCLTNVVIIFGESQYIHTLHIQR